MKVAIVSFYMLESVLPLAKYMADEGNEVHVFSALPTSNQNAYVVNFSNNKQPKGFIPANIVADQMGSKLCEYLSGITTKFFIFSAGMGIKAFLPDILYAWKLSQYLIKNKYSVINVVHYGGRFSLWLLFFLRKQKLVQTLHEVTAHNGKTNAYVIRALKAVCKYNVSLIFHSAISKQRFIEFRQSMNQRNAKENLIATIPFGLYETYLQFAAENTQNKLISPGIKKHTILHFGRIVPYKGIDILIEAVKIAQHEIPIHLVIAGSGQPYFDFDGVDSYEFINKELSNEEIVSLIKNSTAVICPYKSASQSGIPVTVYPFLKPIIASNQGGFTEIIEHNVTGLIVEELKPEILAAAIARLISDKELLDQMTDNIKRKFETGSYHWPNIAKQTLGFYSKVLLSDTSL